MTTKDKELKELKKGAKVVSGLLESGLKKLKVIPKGVVDPEKWLKVHKPKLLKDPDVESCILTWKVMGGQKDVKNWLRKRTKIRYEITFSPKKANTLKTLLQDTIIDYDYNRFNVNMAKGLLHEYFQYTLRDEVRMYISSRELTMIVKAFTTFITEFMTEEEEVYKPEQETIVAVLELLSSFLKKNVIRYRSTYIRVLNEDGTMGEGKFDKAKDVVSVMDVIKSEILKGVVKSG